MPVYLAFNHAGPGHYDAVIYADNKVSETFELKAHCQVSPLQPRNADMVEVVERNVKKMAV